MIDFNSPDEALEIMLAQDKRLVAIWNGNKLANVLRDLQNWHTSWDGWAEDKKPPKPTEVEQQVLNEVMYRDLFKTTPVYGTDSHLAVSTLKVPLADPYMPTPAPVAPKATAATKKTTRKRAPKPNPFDGKPN